MESEIDNIDQEIWEELINSKDGVLALKKLMEDADAEIKSGDLTKDWKWIKNI